MKKLIFICLLLAGCGGGSGAAPVQYTAPVSSITIKGDSMAAGVNAYGTTQWWLALMSTVENNGVSGAPIEYLIINPDNRHLQKVILFVGFNNIKHSEQSVSHIIDLYAQAISTIHADKLICVGVPFMDHVKSDTWYPEGAWITNARIQAVNDGIKGMCPNYLDTSDVDSLDGVHPVYDKIIERLLMM
jgi:hypothetical protein